MKIKKPLLVILTLFIMFVPVIVFGAEPEYVGQDFCKETNVINATRVIGYFIVVMKLVVPFLIIGFGILDLAKAVTEGDDAKVSKGVQSIGIRLLIGIVIFLLPTLIDVLLDGLMDEETNADFKICQTCILDPFACENGEPTDIYDATDIFTDPSRESSKGTATTESKASTSFISTEPKPSTDPITTEPKPETKPVTTPSKPKTQQVTTKSKNHIIFEPDDD